MYFSVISRGEKEFFFFFQGVVSALHEKGACPKRQKNRLKTNNRQKNATEKVASAGDNIPRMKKRKLDFCWASSAAAAAAAAATRRRATSGATPRFYALLRRRARLILLSDA